MAIAVVTGAMCTCTFGTAPSTLNVTSQTKVLADGRPVATIQDNQTVNLPPFLMCTSPANPAVVAAQGAPQPCQMVPVGTWIATSIHTVGGKPVLTNSATCMCAYGGSISVANPGQQKVLIK